MEHTCIFSHFHKSTYCKCDRKKPHAAKFCLSIHETLFQQDQKILENTGKLCKLHLPLIVLGLYDAQVIKFVKSNKITARLVLVLQ